MTSGLWMISNAFDQLAKLCVGSDVASPSLQNAPVTLPATLKWEPQVETVMKMTNGKRTAWIAGAALVALTSGCLEGNNANLHGETVSYDVPTSQRTSASADLLNADGLDGLNYPLGTPLSVVHANPIGPAMIYKTQIEVSNEQELADAMIVPPTDQGHLIVLKNSIVIDHDLTLRGDVDITSFNADFYLRFSPGTHVVILTNQKSDAENQRLRSCTSTIWQIMSGSSSLRLEAAVDGHPMIQAHAFFHLVIAKDSAAYATFDFDSAADGFVLAVIAPQAQSAKLNLNPARTWLARMDNNEAYFGSSATTVFDERLLIIDPPRDSVDSDLVYASNCQNLKKDVLYPFGAYLQISSYCSNAHWDRLATTFATCGGAQ